MNRVQYIDNQFNLRRVLHYDCVTNTLFTMKSTTILYSQIHEIAHSNYIGFVLLASTYNNQRPEKNWHFLLTTLRYSNERPKNLFCQG